MVKKAGATKICHLSFWWYSNTKLSAQFFDDNKFNIFLQWIRPFYHFIVLLFIIVTTDGTDVLCYCFYLNSGRFKIIMFVFMFCFSFLSHALLKVFILHILCLKFDMKCFHFYSNIVFFFFSWIKMKIMRNSDDDDDWWKYCLL